MNKYKVSIATITSSLLILGCNQNDNGRTEYKDMSASNHPIECNDRSASDCKTINQKNSLEQQKYEPRRYELTADGFEYFNKNKSYYANEFHKKKYLDYGKWNNLEKYTSAQIYKYYQDNEVGANLKFSTPFAIIGKVRSFSSGIGDTPSIHFDVGNHFNGVTAIFSTDQSNYIGKLKKGESIELWCTQSKDFGSSAILQNCITPEEIQNFKNEKLSSDLKLFLQGKNPNHHIWNEILYAIILNEKKHPFISCKNKNNECIYDEILDQNPKTAKQLKFEKSLIELYAVAKVMFLAKTMYGNDFLKKSFLANQKEFISAKDLEELIKATDDPLQHYKKLIEINEEKYKSSKVLQQMNSEIINIEQFKY